MHVKKEEGVVYLKTVWLTDKCIVYLLVVALQFY